jgi:hypothetical protein
MSPSSSFGSRLDSDYPYEKDGGDHGPESRYRPYPAL